MSTYILKENEVKMVGPKYNPKTGEFLGLYENVGFIVVRGSPEEVFFNYGYDKEKSKVLYAHHKGEFQTPSAVEFLTITAL